MPERATHRCHAIGCQAAVAPAKLMCRRHWRMVPKDLRVEVQTAYKPGQEISKRPTSGYVRAAIAARRAVAELEGVAREA